MLGDESGYRARVCFYTLGCPKNDADTRWVERKMRAAGVKITEDPALSTHIIVNTCGFIQDAKEESIEAILSVCQQHQEQKVLVMGCLVERYRDELSRGIPEVSGWFGVAGGQTGDELVRSVRGGEAQGLSADRETAKRSAYAYLKISDGCDEGCSFCAIPGIKGPYAGQGVDEIVREADACLSEGARELVLVGQDTTRWRCDGLDLRGLVDLLSEDARTKRVRVMYLQPTRVSAALLDFMAGHAKLCRYLDIPFQHSHGDVLRRMGRVGEGDKYGALLERARSLMPDVAVRSTFIIGFPGETEVQFKHLLAFVHDAAFDYGGAFVYSPEEGTSAASLRPLVRRHVAQRRLELLNEAVLLGGIQRREQLVGRRVEVMVDDSRGEELEEGAIAVGRTAGQAPEVDGVTYIKGPAGVQLAAGDLVQVTVDQVLGCDLVGEICAP